MSGAVVPAGTELSYTVTWLEMAARPSYGWPHAPQGAPIALMRSEAPPVWWLRALYDAVGRDYAWDDVARQSDAEVAEWLAPKRLFVALRGGWPHGFFVLDEAEAGVTDISYFGLVPEAVGRGLGGWLLRSCVLTAWERPGLERLTVNTCTLDHPRALPNYQRAGFTPVRRSEHVRTLTRDRDPSRIPD